MKSVDSLTFASFIGSRELVLVAFVDPQAAAVVTFLPGLEAVAAKHPRVAVGVVDVTRNRALATDFHITEVPTLALLRERVLLFLEPGALTPDALDALLREAQQPPPGKKPRR